MQMKSICIMCYIIKGRGEMKFRKITAIIPATALCMSVAACSQGEKQPEFSSGLGSEIKKDEMCLPARRIYGISILIYFWERWRLKYGF